MLGIFQILYGEVGVKAKEAAQLTQANWYAEPKPEMNLILETIKTVANHGEYRTQIAMSLTPYQVDYLRDLGYQVSLKMYNQYFEISWFHHIPKEFLDIYENGI